MIISDEMWERLQPATEPFEGVERDDVELGLIRGDYKLFSSGNSVAIVSPFNNILRIGLAGGEIKELLTIEKEINQYALKEGFTTLEIIGRAGWEKVLHGCERVAVMLRKDVHHGIH